MPMDTRENRGGDSGSIDDDTSFESGGTDTRAPTTSDATEREEGARDDVGGMEDDASSGCDSDHRKVGWTAELQGPDDYDVSGTAKIVDNCTIAIENFSYDGTGLDRVELYGTPVDPSTTSNPFEQGYSMSRNLKGTVFNNERFVTDLPDDKSLDDLTAVSVWCVEAGADFGSGMLTE